MNFPNQDNVGFLKKKMKEMIKVISEWQADLVLLDIHDVRELLKKKEHVDLFRQAFKMNPEVKVIAIVINNEQNKHIITQIDNRRQEAGHLSNLIILQEFETIFLEDLGLIVHGGCVGNEGDCTYLPKLARLDDRWPNLLVLPANYLSSLTDKDISRLATFDYTTLHPWLKQKVDPSDDLLGETGIEKSGSKSFYIKGMIEKDSVSWEIKGF